MFPIRDLNPTRIAPIVTVGLILINVVVFFAWQPRNDPAAEVEFLYERAAIGCELTTGTPLSKAEIISDRCTSTDAAPVFPDKNIWLAVFISMFLQGSLGHIISNMWFLWLFGNNVEEAFGAVGYLAMYLAAGVVATAVFVAANPGSTVPLIGASGAIAGVLGAYLVLFPTHRVLTFFFFMFAYVPAGAYLVLWLFLQFAYQEPGVAWEAHIGGFVFGAAVALLLRPMLLARVRRIHRAPPPVLFTR